MASINPTELEALADVAVNKNTLNRASVGAGFIRKDPEFVEPNLGIRLRNHMQPYLYRIEKIFDNLVSGFKKINFVETDEMTNEYYEAMLEYILGAIREHELRRYFEAQNLKGMFVIPPETTAEVHWKIPKDDYDEISGLLFDIKDKKNIVKLCKIFKERVTNDMGVPEASRLMCSVMNEVVSKLEAGEELPSVSSVLTNESVRMFDFADISMTQSDNAAV